MEIRYIFLREHMYQSELRDNIDRRTENKGLTQLNKPPLVEQSVTVLDIQGNKKRMENNQVWQQYTKEPLGYGQQI